MKTVTALKATPHLLGHRIDLRWKNPAAAEFQGGAPFSGIRIVRRERMFARDPEDGVIVYDGPVIDEFVDTAVVPLRNHYYRVFTFDTTLPPAFFADAGSEAVALSGQDFGLAERLYRLLPAVHQSLDRPLTAAERDRLDPAIRAALDALPADLRETGQLRRFFHSAPPFDLIRSFAEVLDDIHDVDRARPDFLPRLAGSLGWDLDLTLPVYSQRSEVRAAPKLFRNVGTIPSLRQFVTRYTGWYTQAAELAQNLTRSHRPAQLNLFSTRQDAGGAWVASDDAAPVLGFGPGSNEAVGAINLPAVLVGSVAEPFALRPRMRLMVTADDRVPVTVRFGAADFADISAATAAEVAAVLNATLSEVTATALGGGFIELRSHTIGANSSIRIAVLAAEQVSLESAPTGRLVAIPEPGVPSPDRVRLFFASADPELRLSVRAARETLARLPRTYGLAPDEAETAVPGGFGSVPVLETGAFEGRLLVKTFRGGEWGSALTIPPGGAVAASDPAAVLLPNGYFLAWIEKPHTADARLRWRSGTTRPATPARLGGMLSAPFRITVGSRLLFRDGRDLLQGFEFAASDFVTPSQATAAEVVAALNLRLTGVSASVQPDQTIAIETVEAGEDQWLEILLAESSAARSLGFDDTNRAAQGDWGDPIDWDDAQDVAGVVPGRHTDLFALADAVGVVWLFWSRHEAGTWQVVSTRWDGVAWTPIEILAEGPGGSREPAAALDGTDRIWLLFSRRDGVGTIEDTWTLRRRVFDPVPATWNAEAAVTTPPGPRVTDREPSLVLEGAGVFSVFFRSDRGGGWGVWQLSLDPGTGIASPPALALAGPEGSHWPAPVDVPNLERWLLFRSDRSVSPATVAMRSLPARIDRVNLAAPTAVPSLASMARSLRAEDSGAFRRHAGSLSVLLSDLARISRRRQLDDLLNYTPQKPVDGRREPPLTDDEIYTRGTIALYLSRTLPLSPLTQQMIDRLKAALKRFIPINVRVVVILAPRVEIEVVYTPQEDIGESFLDEYPEIEFYDGPVDDAEAALPDWLVLLSNTLGHVSANPLDLTTLHRRSFFLPPE